MALTSAVWALAALLGAASALAAAPAVAAAPQPHIVRVRTLGAVHPHLLFPSRPLSLLVLR